MGEGAATTSRENSEEDEGDVGRATQVLAELSWALKGDDGMWTGRGEEEEAE